MGSCVAKVVAFALLAGAAWTVPSAGAATRTVLATQVACRASFQVRPHEIVLACADENAYFGALRWTSWTAAVARGDGAYMLNPCSPTCASSNVRNQGRVRVVASRPRTAHGTRFFSRLSVTLVKNGRVLVMQWRGSSRPDGGYWLSTSGGLTFSTS